MPRAPPGRSGQKKSERRRVGRTGRPRGVFVSCVCGNKSPQTGVGGGRLKTHLFSLGSGGRTSEIKVPEAWAPSASTAGDLTPRPSPAFGGRRQPWASPGLNTQQPDLRLCLFLHLAFPCPLFLGGHQSLDLGAALVQCNLVLTNLQRPYFPTKTAF